MNFLVSITICISWFFMLKWFKNNTCVFGNHHFKFKGSYFICEKCGLMKRVLKNE
jgi:hypothetical protein